MTSNDFKQNMKLYLDKCDTGEILYITRKGKVYQLELVK